MITTKISDSDRFAPLIFLTANKIFRNYLKWSNNQQLVLENINLIKQRQENVNAMVIIRTNFLKLLSNHITTFMFVSF